MEGAVVGIYGGTFDPPHEAHLSVARAALDRGLADEVWLMVSPENPFKTGRHISPESDRLAMTRLAIQGIPGLLASDFEFSLPKPSYTYRTLCALRDAFPDRRFTLIIGGDNLETFGRWRNPDRILEEFGLVVYPRPGYSLPDALRSHPNVRVLEDVAQSPVSSSEIRRRAAEGESLSGLVAPEVESYIREHCLYSER